MGEDAFRLVVHAVSALGHLAIALDLFLAAHITCPCNPPPLGVAAAFVVVCIIVGKQGALRHLRWIKGPTAKDAGRRRVHHGWAGIIVAGR